MRKRLSILCLLALCLSAGSAGWAQTKDFSAFLKTVSGKTVEMRMKVTASDPQSGQSVSGYSTLKYRDGMYSVSGDGVDLRCDGKTQWTLMKASKEAVIDNAPNLDMSKPENLLEACGISARKADISVKYDEKGLVREAAAKLNDGSSIVIKTVSVSLSDKFDRKAFRFDTSKLGPAWVVTDLR